MSKTIVILAPSLFFVAEAQALPLEVCGNRPNTADNA